MKVKIYLRIGKTKKGVVKVAASNKPNYTPLANQSFSGKYNLVIYPTVMFALVLDLPDDLFKQAEKVIGEIKIDKEKVTIATTIPELEIQEKEIGGE